MNEMNECKMYPGDFKTDKVKLEPWTSKIGWTYGDLDISLGSGCLHVQDKADETYPEYYACISFMCTVKSRTSDFSTSKIIKVINEGWDIKKIRIKK